MNIVEQINDAITSSVSTILGPTYSELNYIINVDKNNFKGNSKRYGVRPLSGSSVDGLLRNYNVDQEFQLILTHDFINVVNDSDQQAKTFLLYDKLDSILKEIICTKAGIPNIILNIQDFVINEPEYSLEESVVLIRLNLTVKYRQALTGI